VGRSLVQQLSAGWQAIPADAIDVKTTFAILHRCEEEIRLAMIRNNRLVTRIMFAVVLVTGLMGGVVTASLWQVDVANLTLPGLEDQADWVDAVSIIGEQAIQFFLGWTNSGG